MSLTPLRFTGISSYSSDFQTIADRAVSIASLPVKAIQQDQAKLLSQQAALSALNGAVADLAARLTAVGTKAASGAISASSNSSKLSVAVSGSAATGTWRVDSIDSVAESAIATSASGFDAAASTPVAGPGNFLRLNVGSTTHDLTIGDGEDNLNAIRDKINSLGAGVTASVLYSGGSGPKYYLTLTAAQTGAQTLSLESRSVADPEAAGTLLTSTTRAGSDAVVWINGVKVQRSSNRISDAIPGLTLTVNQKTSGDAITIESSPNRSSVRSALEGFADSYNAVMKTIDAQMGETAGVLSGNSIIRQIRSQLSSLAAFEMPGSSLRFATLGLTFDRSGVLSVDSSALEGMSPEAFGQALDYLGPTKGLASLSARLTSISDSTSGLIQRQIDEINTTNKRMSARVEEMTDRINSMQQSLLEKLQKADALLATLDSQRSMLDASITSLNMVLYGKKGQ